MNQFDLTWVDRPADAELVADLKRVARVLGKNLVTVRAYSEQGRYDPRTLSRRFGSWNKALAAAELVASHSNDITETALFENLEAVWIGLGRQPSFRDMNSSELSKYSADTYKRRWGTWKHALETFVEFVRDDDAGANVAAAKSSTRRARSRDASLRLRFLVMRRDRFRCQLCGTSPATDSSTVLEVDHIRAWADGGDTVLANLQTLCARCNQGKSKLPIRGGA